MLSPYLGCKYFFNYIVSVKNRTRKDRVWSTVQVSFHVYIQKHFWASYCMILMFICVMEITFKIIRKISIDNTKRQIQKVEYKKTVGIQKDSYSMLSNLWLLLHLINCGARSSLRNLFQIQYLKHCFEFFSMSLIWVLAFCLLPSSQIWKGTSQIRVKYLLM